LLQEGNSKVEGSLCTDLRRILLNDASWCGAVYKPLDEINRKPRRNAY
jgi:hypothetical protein